MFSFTFDKIADQLIAKKKSGCEVLVIADASREGNENDQIPKLKQHGIAVRERSPNSDNRHNPKMHNKFVVVDKKLVVHGSLNWTLSAVLHNYETAVISSEKSLVRDFRKQFDHLWLALE